MMQMEIMTDYLSRNDDKLSILIVEDDLVYLRLAVDVLQGHPRHTAHTAKEGLEIFEQIQPDITFLDIGLPDANGLDLLAMMKKICPEAFIVMVTASHVAEDVEKAKYLGAAGYVAKPFSRGKMLTYLNLYDEYVQRIERLDTEALSRLYQECFEHAQNIQMSFESQESPEQLRWREKDEMFHNWRLLYVDEDPDNCERVCKRLKQAGCAIEVASSVQAARDAVSRFHYDMLFISQEMQELSGMRLADELRRAEHWMPIVIITEDKLLPGDRTHRHLKIAAFIIKPAKYNTLLTVLRMQIEKFVQLQDTEYVS